MLCGRGRASLLWVRILVCATQWQSREGLFREIGLMPFMSVGRGVTSLLWQVGAGGCSSPWSCTCSQADSLLLNIDLAYTMRHQPLACRAEVRCCCRILNRTRRGGFSRRSSKGWGADARISSRKFRRLLELRWRSRPGERAGFGLVSSDGRPWSRGSVRAWRQSRLPNSPHPASRSPRDA